MGRIHFLSNRKSASCQQNWVVGERREGDQCKSIPSTAEQLRVCILLMVWRHFFIYKASCYYLNKQKYRKATEKQNITKMEKQKDFASLGNF